MANANWKCLQPEKLSIDPNSTLAEDEWNFWFKTFTNFVEAMPRGENAVDKLSVLTAYLTAPIYKLISKEATYEGAIAHLERLFVKPKNEIYARYMLAVARQSNNESIDAFVLRLNKLCQNCDFSSVDAQKYQDDMKRDSFISGISSSFIRQRLLENQTLSFAEAYEKARSFELAKLNNDTYLSEENNRASTCAVDIEACVVSPPNTNTLIEENTSAVRTRPPSRKFVCFFCGDNKWHPRDRCPAKNKTCDFCAKVGHLAKCCLRKKESIKARSSCINCIEHHVLASAALQSTFPPQVLTEVTVNNKTAQALIDTGSTCSYISQDFVKKYKLRYKQAKILANMANSSLQTEITGVCYLNLKFLDYAYKDCKFYVMSDLIADSIIGDDILQQHKSVTFNFGGIKPELQVSAIMPTARIPYPDLFQSVPLNCKPIAVKTRKFSIADQAIIKAETERLLNEGRIEKSKSSWRAQPLVVTTGQKQRMCIDYSQTVNLYTALDAYPLPNIDSIVNEVAKWKHISTLDLKSAYHQIRIRPEDRPYTAFQSGDELYQWKVMPFGLTNAVPAFQRVMHEFIARYKLKGVNVYLDNLTVGGMDQKSHDENLIALKEAAKLENFTFNEDKCHYNRTQIQLLGHLVGDGVIKPDPDRIAALMELKPPATKKDLQRILGLFSYYAKWISKFSDTIRPLIQTNLFPLSNAALKAFDQIKSKLADATLQPIDEDAPFTVETDASDFAIGATLNQNGKPVAFYARTFSQAEQKHSAVEKEAYAVIEALRKWKHLLLGKHFNLVTDQRSVSFMLDLKHRSKIKNDKILRWRLELTAFDFTIIYRPGKFNSAPDTLSRATTASILHTSQTSLKELHESLCHPGITRLLHYVRVKNLPYSLNDVKNVTQTCKDCCEIKASFLKPKHSVNLIKATQPFERISIDFKGPLKSTTRNNYLLVIVDEFTRFPFAYACNNMKASTVIQKLSDLFSIFGFPSYVHSDQGSNFMSYELKSWLHSMGIPTSRTSRFNPQGNGQVERLNRTLWQTVLLALRTKKLPLTHWEYVLIDALHCIRSLLCTATNCTPHERMFLHSRKSFNGVSLPSWVKPGPVFVKRHNRTKTDLLVEEAELLEANSQYAHVRLEDGREIPVSLRDLAPNPKSFQIDRASVSDENTNHEAPDIDLPVPSFDADTNLSMQSIDGDVNSGRTNNDSFIEDLSQSNGNETSTFTKPDVCNDTTLRRSSRNRRPVNRYGNNIYDC